jgi:hypothetical protein
MQGGLMQTCLCVQAKRGQCVTCMLDEGETLGSGQVSTLTQRETRFGKVTRLRSWSSWGISIPLSSFTCHYGDWVTEASWRSDRQTLSNDGYQIWRAQQLFTLCNNAIRVQSGLQVTMGLTPLTAGTWSGISSLRKAGSGCGQGISSLCKRTDWQVGNVIILGLLVGGEWK